VQGERICYPKEIKWFHKLSLKKAMDEQRLKEKIRACELKISDMEQQVLILKMKIEREKQILKKYQQSFENEGYVEIKREVLNG